MRHMPKNNFSKEERLHKKRHIDQLFTSKQAFTIYPYRVIYQFEPTTDQKPAERAACLISVAKKRFKRAVARNRLKRLTREAYRLNKSPLCKVLEEKDLTLHFALIAICDDLPSFARCQKAMKQVVSKLSERAISYGK